MQGAESVKKLNQNKIYVTKLSGRNSMDPFNVAEGDQLGS
jgi:hypothetical protein